MPVTITPESQFLIALGQRLSDRRRNLKFTRAALCRRSGVPVWLIRNIETGVEPPGLLVLLNLCQCLTLDLHDALPRRQQEGWGRTTLAETLDPLGRYLRLWRSISDQRDQMTWELQRLFPSRSIVLCRLGKRETLSSHGVVVGYRQHLVRVVVVARGSVIDPQNPRGRVVYLPPDRMEAV